MAAGVGHEINNPLTIIWGNAEKLKKFQFDNDTLFNEYKAILQKHDRAIRRISDVVNGLRIYAKTESSSYEHVDIHTFIDDTLSLIRGIYKTEGVNFILEKKAVNTFVNANFGQFQQVFINLFSNAKDALEEKDDKKIWIKTSNLDDKILIEITDNGVGIDKMHIDKIFDSFFTTKEIGKGVGLGLGLSQDIITKMNGKIEVKSEKGLGATFTISLPIAKECPINIELSPKTPDYKKFTGKVLIVDDEEDIREILAGIIKSFGFIVEEAEDGLIALNKIRKEKYDIVLTDLKMPKMDGVELINNVKKLDGLKPNFIIVTGGIVTDKSDKGFETFSNLKKISNGFILKPFSKNDIYQALLGLN